jgi:hypothetical protein
MSYDEACAKLGEFPATVSGYPKYLSHAVAVFTTSATMVKRMRLTAPRRNRLDKHSNELQAAKKVAEEFLALCKETVLLVWGDGNFSPSTRGHAPAPNKRLQRLLSKYIPIVTSSEYKTSQMSPCCGVPFRELPSPGRKRAVSKVCPKCNVQWNRDVAAALNIGHIFKLQCQTCDHSSPLQLR